MSAIAAASGRSVPLRALAHSRSGDKGRTLNVSVIAYDPAAYGCIAAQLTTEAFAAWHAGLFEGPVTRYEVPRLGAMNFVCEGALGGGVSRNLCLDNYGKALASRVLAFPLALPPDAGFALREPAGDPLLPYLRAAGIDPDQPQETPWTRALLSPGGGTVTPPGRTWSRAEPDSEAGGRSPQDPTITGGTP